MANIRHPSITLGPWPSEVKKRQTRTMRELIQLGLGRKKTYSWHVRLPKEV